MARKPFLQLLLLATLLLSGDLAAAQTTPTPPKPPARESLGLTPALVDVAVKKGTAHVQTFTLVNNSRARVRFRCRTGDLWYDAQANNQLVLGKPGTQPRSAASWVQFFPEEVIAEPRTSVPVQVIVSVPPTASGSYYFTPIFQGEDATPPIDLTKPDTPQGRASIAIEMFGVMMLTVEGASEYKLDVVRGETLPPTLISELLVNLDLANHGTAHTRVRGIFAILDKTGRVMGSGKIDERTILPEQKLTVNGSWANELPPGEYTNIVTLTYVRVGLQPASLVYEIPFKVAP